MNTQPNITPISERYYRLDGDYIYYFRGCVIRVPDGFITDGASVPRSLWSVTGFTPDGLYRAGAVVHDFIYKYAGVLPAGSYSAIVPIKRARADKIFLGAMKEFGVTKARRLIIYSAVWLFGWAAWGK